MQPSSDPDVEAMLAFQHGDEDAFVTLYRKWRDRIFNFTRRLLGDAAAGEEATQDVFVKLYEARNRYRPESRFSTFLYRIATNHCFKLKDRHDWKKTDRDGAMDLRPSAAGSTEGEAARAQLREALRRALAMLPERQGSALILCQYDGMSYEEAAAVLGVSESAIKSLVHRARVALCRRLRPWMEEETSHAV